MDDETEPHPPTDAEPHPPTEPAGERSESAEPTAPAETTSEAGSIPSAPVPAAPDPSGLAPVDSAVEQLDGLDERPVHEHVEVFDDVQRRLHDALAELDDEQ